MPKRVPGRHRSSQVPVRSYAIVFIAALAALTGAFGLSGGFASAAVPAAPVTARMADRAAESPALDVSRADIRAQLAQIAVTARITATARAAAVLAAHTYTVRDGDSISSVAWHRCHHQSRFWTGTYVASRARHWTARNANTLAAGQHLYISCTWAPSALKFAPAPRPVIHRPVWAAATVSTGSGYTARSVTVSTRGMGGYQACVIARESGGSSQVMNASGHYGLYQFDYGTWVSGGGRRADFGHASVAEQNRVFAAVYAARGTQPWTPSDGC